MELAAWNIGVFCDSYRIGHWCSIVGINPFLVHWILLFFIDSFVRNCFEDHAFSLHNKVVINWGLFETFGAMHVFSCIFWHIFGGSTLWFIYASYAHSSNAYSRPLEVLLCTICVSFLSSSSLVLVWVSNYSHGYLWSCYNWRAIDHHIVCSYTASSILLISLSRALSLLSLLFVIVTPLWLYFCMMIMHVCIFILILNVF